MLQLAGCPLHFCMWLWGSGLSPTTLACCALPGRAGLGLHRRFKLHTVRVTCTAVASTATNRFPNHSVSCTHAQGGSGLHSPPLALLQVTVLQRQIADVDAQIREAQKYLKMADPDGYYVEGSAAAEAAKALAQRAAREEQMRRQEAQRQQRLKLVGVARVSLLSAG